MWIFDCWHLRKGVYEEAAREAGLRGELKWGVTSVPERYLRGDGEGRGEFVGVGEFICLLPNYGVLVIAK